MVVRDTSIQSVMLCRIELIFLLHVSELATCFSQPWLVMTCTENSIPIYITRVRKR